jgi:spore maturation protein CgeB
MRVGFYIKYPTGSLARSKGNVVGDELYAESLCRALLRSTSVKDAAVYGPNQRPSSRLDVMVYMNDSAPEHSMARLHMLYLQNAYGEGCDKKLRELHARPYDGYAFISHRLLELHRSSGRAGIFLPFGVDLDLFSPRSKQERYSFDVAYVGSDIKGEQRTNSYLLPATKFHFGLYGNWPSPDQGLRGFVRSLGRIPEYKRTFHQISRGKIPQADVPVLYSSAAINLNCTAQDCVDWDVITLRTLEVLACRGFLITDKVPVAMRTMEGCMVFTEGDRELTEQLSHYITHPEERAAIADKGYAYVKASASVDSRAKELSAYLESLS